MLFLSTILRDFTWVFLFCCFLLPRHLIYLIRLVAIYFSRFRLFSVYRLLIVMCYPSDSVAGGRLCERMLHQSQSSTFLNEFILMAAQQKNGWCGWAPKTGLPLVLNQTCGPLLQVILPSLSLSVLVLSNDLISFKKRHGAALTLEAAPYNREKTTCVRPHCCCG